MWHPVEAMEGPARGGGPPPKQPGGVGRTTNDARWACGGLSEGLGAPSSALQLHRGHPVGAEGMCGTSMWGAPPAVCARVHRSGVAWGRSPPPLHTPGQTSMGFEHRLPPSMECKRPGDRVTGGFPC